MNEKKLKIGILGAAKVSSYALIAPAKHLPFIEIYAVASRSTAKAKKFAKKYGIFRTYSYEELLENREIEAIYNPLPNSLHCEWSIRAMEKGKHVLCEKPIANNAEEAKKMALVAQRTNRILVEAFHYRYHPLITNIKDIIQGGMLGKISYIETNLSAGIPNNNDIRFFYQLGGGAGMDMGCYGINLLRFLTNEEPEVTSAKAKLIKRDVDFAMEAKLLFPSGIVGKMMCSLKSPIWKWRSYLKIVGEKGNVKILGPYHRAHLKLVGDGISTEENWYFGRIERWM